MKGISCFEGFATLPAGKSVRRVPDTGTLPTLRPVNVLDDQQSQHVSYKHGNAPLCQPTRGCLLLSRVVQDDDVYLAA